MSGSGIFNTTGNGPIQTVTGISGSIFDLDIASGPFAITGLSGYAAADNLSSHQILLPCYRKLLGVRLQVASCMATIALAIFSVLYFVVPVGGSYKAPILFSSFLLFLPLTFVFQNHYKFDKAIGELSYPIYIGHFLVIFFVGLLFKKFGIVNDLANSITNALLSMMFAAVLNWAIGDRIEAIRATVRGRGVKRSVALSVDPLLGFK